MKSAIVLIDGGFLRSVTKAAQKVYDPPFIQSFAQACLSQDEECLRVLYYDCSPFVGRVLLPVSGTEQQFTGSDRWLHELAALDLFAVRRGVLKFRGFERKRNVLTRPPTDDDFKTAIRAKGCRHADWVRYRRVLRGASGPSSGFGDQRYGLCPRYESGSQSGAPDCAYLRAESEAGT